MVLPAYGQQASKEDVVKLLETMRVKEQTAALLQVTFDDAKTAARQAFLGEVDKPTPDDMQHLDRILDGFTRAFSVDQLIEDMVPIYQKHLTKSDVEGLIAFYSTPLGKKLLNEMPAMTEEAMQTSSERMRGRLDEMMEKIKQEFGSKNKARTGKKVLPRA
jgi:hypothetical protein